MIRPTTSASNIHRRALCPGSERLEAGQPEQDNEQSKEGQLLHAYDAAPKLERAVLKPQQRDLLRISAELDEFIFARVHDQFAIPKEALFDEGRERELMAIPGTEVATPGHCDRWRLYPVYRVLVIIDKKFGYKIVEPAAANYQLRVYAIGGVEEWCDVDQVVVAITQPRLSYSERVTMAAYSRQDIQDSIAELTSIRATSSRSDAPLRVSDLACRYCKGKLVCPAYQDVVGSGMALVKTDGGTVAKRQADVETIVANCTDEQLDRILVAIQMAHYAENPAKDEARLRIKEGRLTNYKLKESAGDRKIIDPARAVALLSLKGDLNRDEILACCAPTIGKLEEKLRDKLHLTWDKAKALVNELLSSVIEREPKKPSLIREGPPRPIRLPPPRGFLDF